jgi:hypothetical protein
MESLSELDYLVLYTKLSSCLWAHKSGRAGSTDRSAGLLVGRARLSRMAETLVGGDLWVPMSHKSQPSSTKKLGFKIKHKDAQDIYP